MSKDVSGSQSFAISVDEIFGSIWLTTSFAGLIHRYTMAIIQAGWAATDESTGATGWVFAAGPRRAARGDRPTSYRWCCGSTVS